MDTIFFHRTRNHIDGTGLLTITLYDRQARRRTIRSSLQKESEILKVPNSILED